MTAIPAFKDRESEFLDEAPAGALVRGVWGAMYPEWYGRVIGKRQHDGPTEFEIRWSDGTESTYQIRATRSVNGSPIGVWLA